MQKSTKNLISVITVCTLFVLSFLSFMEALDLFAEIKDEIPTDLRIHLSIYIALSYVFYFGGLYLYKFTVKDNAELTEEKKN